MVQINIPLDNRISCQNYADLNGLAYSLVSANYSQEIDRYGNSHLTHYVFRVYEKDAIILKLMFG